MSGYPQSNMNPNQIGMNQGQQVPQMHQQMYQQHQQQVGMNRMMNMQQQNPQHQQQHVMQQHGGMNQGQQMQQMHQQMYQQQQQHQVGGLNTTRIDSQQGQQHQMHQQSGLLGQPPPQSNPTFGGGQMSAQMNPGSVGSMQHLQMSTGNGTPSTPQQQQQLSAPSVSVSGDTPSPIPPITNPSSQQPPLSNAPASISSDIPTANSVLGGTPGPSTSSAADGQASQSESTSHSSDVHPMLIRADLIARCRDMIGGQLRVDIQQIMNDLSVYVNSYFPESTGAGESRLTGGPPSVTAPLSVNDLSSLGPSSVKSSEGPHSVGVGSVKPEESKNSQEAVVNSGYNTLGTIDQLLNLLETAKHSMTQVHRMEKMFHVAPMAGNQHGPNPGEAHTSVFLTQQASQQLENQERIDLTCQTAINNVMSMINAVNEAQGRSALNEEVQQQQQQDQPQFDDMMQENGAVNNDNIKFEEPEPDNDQGMGGDFDNELNF